ncbi:hypothetical protein AB0J72_25125 [Dactylosporangium sp. NPDC049742]|uniref:hypothetical protein n=1 Tax=Dactylosporangium sp. NPDC049742 TaxID=3154737 RepID=UPI0034487D61
MNTFAVLTELAHLNRRVHDHALLLMTEHTLAGDVAMTPRIELIPVGDGIRAVLSHHITFGAAHEIRLALRLTVTPAGYDGDLHAGIVLDPPDDRFPGAGRVARDWPAPGPDVAAVLTALETAVAQLCAGGDPFGFLADYAREAVIPGLFPEPED